MARDRVSVVEDRMQGLEHRVELMEYRLRSLEIWRGGERPATPPPPPADRVNVEPVPEEARQPVYSPTPPPILRPTPNPKFGWPQEHATTPAQPKPAPEPARDQPDTEYMIGAKLLPKLGAGLVLLAILFFVAWGYSAGWITPWMVFTGEIIFSLAFVAVGQWKRGEREQYGQILTGIGSCGLYFSLAGGHLVQNLFSGEVLVASFIALSFANLFYGLASKSKSFLGIGIIGGLAAALMPLHEHKTTLNAILTLVIVLPAALVAAKRRWPDMAGLLWLGAAASLVPLLQSAVPWEYRVGVLYCAALAAVAAYLYSADEASFDPSRILAPILLFATGLIGFAAEHGRLGSFHLLAFGVGSALVAFAAPSGPARSKILTVAAAIPATIAPFCFTRVECLCIFIGLTLVAGALSEGLRSRWFAAFAGIEFTLGLASYLVIESWNPLSAGQETWVLAGLMAAAIAAAHAAVRQIGRAEPFTIGAMALLLPLFCRFGVVAITGSSFSGSPELSAAQALALFALAAIFVTARTKWVSAMAAMWAAFAVAVTAYIYAVSFEPVPVGQDAFLILLLGVTAIVGLPIATGTAPADFRKSISGATGILIGFMAMRLAFLYSTLPSAHLSPAGLVILTGAAYSAAASIIGIMRKSNPAVAVAWTMLAASGFAYVSAGLGVFGLGVETSVVSGLLVAFVLAAAALNAVGGKQHEIWHAIAILGWLVFSRWGDLTLTWGGVALHGASTMTVAWIVYALALLILGFRLSVKELRLWSFAVMFATVSKILLVDLASTNIPFRVAVLLGLGLLMLGGGYWYITDRRLHPRT